MPLRALIGESYLQHFCKHFTSWSAYQPRPVPTGKWTVPGKSARVCALGCGPHKTRTPIDSNDHSLGLN